MSKLIFIKIVLHITYKNVLEQELLHLYYRADLLCI